MDTNFSHRHEEQKETRAINETSAELEFPNSDAALRHDREQNPPPPEIAERLNQSLAEEPKRGTSFWTKLGFKK